MPIHDPSLVATPSPVLRRIVRPHLCSARKGTVMGLVTSPENTVGGKRGSLQCHMAVLHYRNSGFPLPWALPWTPKAKGPGNEKAQRIWWGREERGTCFLSPNSHTNPSSWCLAMLTPPEEAEGEGGKEGYKEQSIELAFSWDSLQTRLIAPALK